MGTTSDITPWFECFCHPLRSLKLTPLGSTSIVRIMLLLLKEPSKLRAKMLPVYGPRCSFSSSRNICIARIVGADVRAHVSPTHKAGGLQRDSSQAQDQCIARFDIPLQVAARFRRFTTDVRHACMRHVRYSAKCRRLRAVRLLGRGRSPRTAGVSRGRMGQCWPRSTRSKSSS